MNAQTKQIKYFMGRLYIGHHTLAICSVEWPDE